MIIAVEILVGPQPTAEIDRAAEVLAEACRSRGFPVERLAAPAGIDNRLSLYLTTPEAGYPLAELLDLGVRRHAFARLDHTQYLVRSWRGQARLHVAMAARSGAALVEAARFVADRITGTGDFSRLDMQGPVRAPGE